jgi:hypothetical protein
LCLFVAKLKSVIGRTTVTLLNGANRHSLGSSLHFLACKATQSNKRAA